MIENRTVVTDPFFKRYKKLVRTEMLPYQWDVLNDRRDIKIERERDDDSIPNEKSHAIENFKIAAGKSKGEHYGWVFQDSDVYKWLEAAAYSLTDEWDEKLKETADGVVSLIAEAQEEDGYINTYFTVMEPERRYRRLGESHELYCAGHLLEALSAYYRVTGNEEAIMVAKKLADHIDSAFGPEDGKIHGPDGHEEIEIGLMKLYHIIREMIQSAEQTESARTEVRAKAHDLLRKSAHDEERYLKLASYFLKIRGTDPDFFDRQYAADGGDPLIRGIKRFGPAYLQMHLPLKDQDTAEGHAVRLVYMCTAMADVAFESGDHSLKDACQRIWRNIVDRRMYITGGIGSTVTGEAFTLDYDLPNDTMYCETCASIGLVFFAGRMLKLDRDSEYADVMERALYNTVLSGMALDGKHFFYVNPLEVVPEKGRKDPGKSHVKSVRPEWLGCACCPPNLARLITSVDDYIYTVCDDLTVLVNLFIRSSITLKTDGNRGDGLSASDRPYTADGQDPEEMIRSVNSPDKHELKDMPEHTISHADRCSTEITIRQESDFPKTGNIRFYVSNPSGKTIRLGIRIPGWTDRVCGSLDNEKQKIEPDRGFWYVEIPGGEHEIEFDMEIIPKRWYANVRVSEDVHKAAVVRGPQIFCLEEKDNGKDLHCLSLMEGSGLNCEWREDLLDGICVIEGKGMRYMPADGEDGAQAAGGAADKERHGGKLYTDHHDYSVKEQTLRFIPYYAWGNRGENEMRVWIPEAP
ncbi:MAG: glycoside hydrolase family 127 protein [Lachnospiraceae bacterium]|nr:glycoside hydrolase family 127 protein [Lachnospiraceae bacterium]